MTKKMKTTQNKASVTDFIKNIADDEQRKDVKTLLALLKELTKKKPMMWGKSIVGFGEYKYKRKDGSEHTFFVSGFSPRKGNLSIYLMSGFDAQKELLEKLGPHKTGVGCLYVKRLSDIHMPTLKKMIKKDLVQMKKERDIIG